MKGKVEALIRLIVALVPAINIILVYFNKSPLPFSEDEINVALSAVVSFIGILWSWWKNNNITFEAQTSQKLLDSMKSDKGKVGGEGNPLEVE